MRGIEVRAKELQVVIVTDPDSGLPVEVQLLKLDTGGIIGVDGSYLANEVGDVYSPFDPGVRLIFYQD